MKPIRETIAARARRALAQRHLTPEEVARRAELHPKTVRRLLDGKQFSEDTVDAVAAAVRVDLVDCGCPESASNRPEPPEIACPVAGWKVAARVLRVPLSTLRAQRERAGDTHGPWWPSVDALVGWYEGLVGERVATVASSTSVPPPTSPSDAPRHPRRQRRANASDRATR